ncbi:DUF5801 repeats-in-toxin domain-containing protein, partial [Roseibium sp. SCP14]|uniref:DUF5801 repeats-in-toxin domain-containing protein n=1 Tax=Roseibium sp. SCP14 TaxID=3141375 RepID=UPI003336F991
VTPTDGDAIMVQTYDGGLTDGNFTGNADGDGVPLVSTASFAGAFDVTADAGADGEASTTVTYMLQLAAAFSEGDPSGLTSANVAINLYEVGGIIYGSTAASEGDVDPANTVFTLEVDGAGNVTLTQSGVIDHDTDESYSGAYINDVQELATGLVELKATAETTDGDGDTATG